MLAHAVLSSVANFCSLAAASPAIMSDVVVVGTVVGQPVDQDVQGGAKVASS